MASGQKSFGRLITFLCVCALALPSIAQAASDDVLASMQAQIQALSKRLDRLEAENRQLVNSNAELVRASQETANVISRASTKTEAVVAEVHDQTVKSDWTDTIHWQGDFRYRYESFDIEGTQNSNRNRIRARAALIADVTPDIQVGLGLASGGDDPVSSNQTLGNGGSTKDLRLDLAYFDWFGLSNTHIVGGKFSNPLHRSGKNALVWDSDWRPEGTGIKWDNGKFFANGLGNWIESDSKKDQSFAYGIQGGMSFPIGDTVYLTAGIGYFELDTRGSGSFFGDENDFFGNSFNPDTNTYLYDYHELELFVEMGFSLFDRSLSVFADFVQNQAADEYDTAYAVGFKYGKASNQGQWEFGYVYQELEADSVFGLLTDSDFGGGGTDAKGHILKGSYAIARNFNAKFTYFINEAGLKSNDPIDFNRLQLDLSFKY